jgi:hypothetical protein
VITTRSLCYYPASQKNEKSIFKGALELKAQEERIGYVDKIRDGECTEWNKIFWLFLEPQG